jgi:heme/copper-type cytochrome/quinol oxidase subunit 4
MDMNTLLSKINLPSVLVFNELESLETNDDEELTIHTYGNDHYLVQWSKSSRMKCRERMELKDFPFDLQRLTLDLRLDAPDASKKYDMGISVVQFHQQAIELTEWEMYPPSIRRHGTDRSEVKIKARRHHMYYLQNIAGTMFMLSLLGLLTFQMDVGDIGSRVGTVLTLILTAVAFKFILSESLPKVPYNTMMDYYIMFAMLSLAATSVICICPAYIPEERVNYRSKINKYLCICAGAVIVLTSVAWIIWAEVRFRITLYDDEEHEQYGSASWSIVNPIKRIIFIINEARRHQDKSASCSVLKPIKRVRPKQDSSNKPGSGDNESKATKGDNWYSYIFSSDKLSIRRPTENNQS